MKTLRLVSLIGALPLSLILALAQDANPPAPAEAPAGPPHRSPPPVIAVLDANQDGLLDATEIANAANALLTLDQNGDGQLTVDELRPPGRGPRGPMHGGRPHRGGGPGEFNAPSDQATGDAATTPRLPGPRRHRPAPADTE